MTTYPVADRHVSVLRDRAISPETARAAQLSSGPDHLRIPWKTIDGIAHVQKRFDRPWVDRDGGLVRYSAGSVANRIYVAPGSDDRLGEPAVPLVICEGALKSLAVSQVLPDVAAVAVSAVWNWKGREVPGDASTPSRPIPDWDRLALCGRRVVVLFDSDVLDNHQVDAARRASRPS